MQHALPLVAVLSLACASSAAAEPDTAPKPAPAPTAHPDACKPAGKAVLEIDHRAVPGAKAATATVKLFGNGAWTREETDADGKSAPQSAGCLAKAEAKHLASELRSAPWKVTTARVHCMAVASTFIEFQLDGKLVFTQKLCSGQSLDDKSRAALDAAIARIDPTGGKPAP